MTLVITGYDDDPREIVDIPEARLFLELGPRLALLGLHLQSRRRQPDAAAVLRSRQALARPRRGGDRHRDAEEGAAALIKEWSRPLEHARRVDTCRETGRAWGYTC